MPDKEFVEERVVYTVHPEREYHFIPRISVAKSSGGLVEKSFRPIEASDISRILDFEGVSEAPPDGPIMHGEDEDDNGNKIDFPRRHFCIRGGFMFYFDENDVTVSGQYNVEYHGPPLGVIPLDKVDVAIPPGGRRVFREHAQTNARTGYEIAILHKGAAGGGDGARPPAFVVTSSLQLRDKWAEAIKARAKVDSQTKLRAVLAYQSDPSVFTSRPQDLLKKSRQNQKGGKDKRSTRKGKRPGTQAESDEPGSNEALVKEALQDFGKSGFQEKQFLDQFFEQYTELDAEGEIPKMEKWQTALKKGLKTAVLEQYEYFVEASGEMTKMGKEVLDLKNMVETQVETIKEMKEIDFEMYQDFEDGDDSDDEENVLGGKKKKGLGDDESDSGSVLSDGGDPKEKIDIMGQSGLKFRDPDAKEGAIEIPEFLDDSPNEILAYVRETRYTDATDLWAKAKLEVIGLLHLHETPTDNYLTKKQYAKIQTLIESLDDLAEKISNRLVENLRRKNEALKQASKRERTDPSAHMVPSVSPCCLNDDLVPLRLLVKLGKTQEAATAYSARRSLLLQESLHERPLAGTSNIDLEIYAAQLSQSFFSCLAVAIEGFLDLFLINPPTENRRDYGLDEGSINTDTGSLRNLPPGALASIVLWCDSELSKFSNSFGGARILGNLPLSPPPRDAAKKGPRVLGKSNGSKERQTAIDTAAKCVSQAFQYASENLDTVGLPLTPRLAESLRKRLKGCEAEVAQAMDEQWKAIVLEWEYPLDDEVDDRR